MVLICVNCGKDYSGRPSSKGRKQSRFCCHGCYAEFNTKTSLSKHCNQCGVSYEVRPSNSSSGFCSRKCVDLSRRSVDFIEGKDRRDSKEQRQWRLEVFKKDNFRCAKCEEVGGQLNAHHILGYARYPDARLVLDNGASLCEVCHREFHKLYGTFKFTDKDYWEWINI